MYWQCTIKNLKKEKNGSILAVYNIGSILTGSGRETMIGSIMEESGENWILPICFDIFESGVLSYDYQVIRLQWYDHTKTSGLLIGFDDGLKDSSIIGNVSLSTLKVKYWTAQRCWWDDLMSCLNFLAATNFSTMIILSTFEWEVLYSTSIRFLIVRHWWKWWMRSWGANDDW